MKGKPMAGPTSPTASLKILVDDDEANPRKTLSVRREAGGHRVAAVGHFEDAVPERSRRSVFFSLRRADQPAREGDPS